jgi:hypothetical protein
MRVQLLLLLLLPMGMVMRLWVISWQLMGMVRLQ